MITLQMRIKLIILPILFFLTPVRFLFAQVEEDTVGLKDTFSLIRESPVTIDLEKEEEKAKKEKKKEKKRRKKKIFYGIKTKKAFLRSGQGDRVVLEVFYYLKEPQKPDPYVQEIYWYDLKKHKIRRTRTFDPKKGVLLHGPYKKIVGNQVMEEGIFYLGTKHGRWTRYNSKDILIDKKKYFKGWPKESKVRYYDTNRTLLKEVIPIVNSVKEGTYYYFHKNGQVGIKGEYKEGVKVGAWTEYYDFRMRRKKEIQYRKDPFDGHFKPYVSREWNRRAQIVYENTSR